MQSLSRKVIRMLSGLTFFVTCFNLFVPVMLAAVINGETGVSLDLRVAPTGLVINPSAVTLTEGAAPINLRALAKYEYPGLTTPIPDKDVTSDDLTTWSVDKPEVALVNTRGEVTPVKGTDSAIVTATYLGKSATATIQVNSLAVQPPSPGSGNNEVVGGGTSGPSIFSPGTDTGTQTPGETTSPPPADNGFVLPGIQEGNPPSDNNNGGTPADTGTGTPSNPSPGNEGGVSTPGTGPGPSQNGGSVGGVGGTQPSPGNSYLPLERPYNPNEVRPAAEIFDLNQLTNLDQGSVKKGVSRSFVVARIAEKLNLLELRKNLLDKCFADLENCTAIFRMYSSFDGINLDPKNLKLFPDLEDVPEKEVINKMALLGVVQGYYGIVKSPFLPNKDISRAETLKILTSIVDNLRKSKSDYVPQKFDFNSLFYQEIYAASLLSSLGPNTNSLIETAIPAPVTSALKIAHALSDQAWELIKQQKTPFSDIRPDLYDAHWYYPIVYNRICDLKLMGCTPGTQVKPDQSPSPEEVDQYISNFDKYIKDQGLDVDLVSDEDKDGLSNIDENVVYLTDPKNSDTDRDGLNDGAEITTLKTDPHKFDTDGDGLSDGDEINLYKTNPILVDTDGDGFSDGEEVSEHSNPLDKGSIPDDKNNNRVADAWELKYNIQVQDGAQDTDADGISDVLEYQYGTDPTKIDTDHDGYTDSEEVLDLHSDPNDPKSPGSPENLPVLINNFQYGQVIADPSPLIKGVGPASLGDNVVQIQILLRNEFGAELMLGNTQTDAKGGFVFFPSIEIKDGTYFLLARAINKGEVKLSEPIKIIVNSKLDVASAKPKKLEAVPITDDVLVKNLVLKVDSTDGRPVLYGTLSEFGSRVNVTWQSLVVSSALIADATDGSFSIKAPKLQEGKHTVYIQTIRKSDNAVGKTLRINFNLGLVQPGEHAYSATGGPSLEGATAVIADFIAHQSWPFWIGVIVVVVLVGGGLYVFVLGDDDGTQKKK